MQEGFPADPPPGYLYGTLNHFGDWGPFLPTAEDVWSGLTTYAGFRGQGEATSAGPRDHGADHWKLSNRWGATPCRPSRHLAKGPDDGVGAMAWSKLAVRLIGPALDNSPTPWAPP